VNLEPAALLGVDWGTTSFRAYLLDSAGRILERRARDAGILRVTDSDFAGTLLDAVGDWLARNAALPVLAAGMIGSRQGWREVPYVPCPAGFAKIAAGLAKVELPDGRPVHLVPGLLRPATQGGFPDVMRGEETQILGDPAASGTRCFVLPGTHSKWAWTAGGHIDRFATYMTGEVYDVLVRHSILGRLMEGADPDDGAFVAGLERAKAGATAAPGALLHDLFSARTLGLTGAVPPTGLASYLSGLLIGAEALSAAGEAAGEVTILGSGTLAPLYGRAMAELGLAARIGSVDSAAHGLHAIASTAGLIGEPRHG
jgi:2-dehydro-3-deoxygalactonokinase